ncbi:MAG TPA: hypothetical protein PLQ11_07275 [Beijerinckiaceae bacterium]|nr:hypothetical protein [Beijerinckiaceae bacterium]
MAVALFLFHLRWFGIFAFIALLTIVYGHLNERGVAALSDPAFYSGLVPPLSVAAALAICVPWIMFLIDPRRPAGSLSLEGFARYWKLEQVQ